MLTPTIAEEGIVFSGMPSGCQSVVCFVCYDTSLLSGGICSKLGTYGLSIGTDLDDLE